MNMAVTLGLMGRFEESLSLFRQVLPEEQAQNNLTILKDNVNKMKPYGVNIHS